MPLERLKILLAFGAAIALGVLCGVFHAPFWLVVLAGLAAATYGFWLERASLMGPETAQRKDFRMLVAAGYGFFAVVGVGVASLACLLSEWYLPRL